MLLACVTLAIIIAFYFLYITIFAPPPEVLEELTPPPKPTTKPRTLTKRDVKKPGNFLQPEEVVLSSPGEKAYFERYSNNRLLYQFRADHWKPAGKPGAFELTNPEMRVFLKRGQIINVSAESGWIETRKSRGTRLDPTKGYLKGRVHIFIDRGTNPNRSAPELRPEDVIHIWLDEVQFNLELNRIESKSAIKVESYDADMIGRGLSITWNEVTNQIDLLKIERGDKLTLYRGANIIQVEVPGGEKQIKQKEFFSGYRMFKGAGTNIYQPAVPISQQLEFTKHGEKRRKSALQSSSRLNLSSRPIATTRAVTSQKATQPHRRSRTYELTFTSDVEIYQYNQVKLTGTMRCSKLKVVFDLPRSSEQSKKNNKTLSTKPASQSQPSARKKQTGKRLEIFWKGPLEMKPVKLPYSPRRRFHIIAYGQPIKINQVGQGKARCKKLKYYEETKQLWLEGTTVEPVMLTQGSNRKIVVVRLFYDRRANMAKGTGPGFMQQETLVSSKAYGKNVSTQPAKQVALKMMNFTGMSRSGGKMRVLWKQGFILHFGQYEKLDVGGKKLKQYLKSAEFSGQVKMTRLGESMSGNFIKLTFESPNPASKKSSEQIETLFATGKVLLKSNQQSIACDILNVKFEDGNFGRIPKFAKAKGNVKAIEKRRIIKAGYLEAVMEDQRFEVRKTLANGQTKKKFKTRIILREVHATGNVSVRDPAQPVKIDCEKLEAKIDEKSTLRFCYLEGTVNKWARAVLQDFYLSGPQITLNLETEQVDIPAPGELQFVNREDIDGSKLSKPVPIAVYWSGFMRLTGGKINQGIFVGDTRVTSKRSTLYSDKLTIYFENLIAQTKTASSKNKGRERFWIFSQLIGGKTREKSPTLRLPITRKRPVYIRAVPAKGRMITVQNVDREAGRLVSRTTLKGRELTVDFKSRRLNVPGNGNLVIEDYRLPNRGKSMNNISTGAMLKNPFGADIKSSGPSQTVFTWQTGLLYLLDRRIAIFDGAIKMIHVAGPGVLAQELGKTSSNLEAKVHKSTLTCENLKVEFLRGAFGVSNNVNAGAAELKKVIATGSVHLNDPPRSVIANRLMYDRSENIIVIEGFDNNPAYLYDEGGDNVTTYSGPLIVWDRQTGEIRAPGASIMTTVK